MEHSPELDKIAVALNKAQAVMEPAVKDASNPFFKSKYADLGSVWDAARKPLTDNGLSVVQLPGFENGVTTLTTMLLHISGQWIAEKAGAPIAKADAQSVGSAISYLRRYSLAAAVGITAEDDDGQAASQSRQSKAPAPKDPRPAGVIPEGILTLPGAASAWGGNGGKSITDPSVSEKVLKAAQDWCQKTDASKYKVLIAGLMAELQRRAEKQDESRTEAA